MQVDLKRVTADEKEILRNLLEKYDFEFSQWNKRDVNELGLFGYPYFDHYWTEGGRWAYFITVDQKLAGFAMITNLPEVDDRQTDFQMAEFFVLHKYRRSSVGKQAFFKVLKIHKGQWQFKLHPANLASVHFWTRVINAYTSGEYELVKSYPGTEYNDGTAGDIFFSESE